MRERVQESKIAKRKNLRKNAERPHQHPWQHISTDGMEFQHRAVAEGAAKGISRDNTRRDSSPWKTTEKGQLISTNRHRGRLLHLADSGSVVASASVVFLTHAGSEFLRS